MSLITSATNTGLATYQLAIRKAPVIAANVAASTARQVAVSDTWSNVSADFEALRNNISKVSTINVSDIGRLEFTIDDFKENVLSSFIFSFVFDW